MWRILRMLNRVTQLHLCVSSFTRETFILQKNKWTIDIAGWLLIYVLYLYSYLKSCFWSSEFQAKPIFWRYEADKDIYLLRWRNNKDNWYSYQVEGRHGNNLNIYSFLGSLNPLLYIILNSTTSKNWRGLQMEAVMKRKEINDQHLMTGIFC